MTQNIRNIGIIAHIDAGKTTTTERILFISGKSHRIGEVDQGTAVMDWMEQEQNRGITIKSATTCIPWKDTTINIIDTPGHVDFTIEVERSLLILDGAVGIFCAVGGAEPQSETVWRQSNHFHVAKIAYINKLDRLGANFYKVLQDIEKKLHIIPVPLFIPIGIEKNFEGIIDILNQKELIWNDSTQGKSFETREIRAAYTAQAHKYLLHAIEQTSEFSNKLADLYLSDTPVPTEYIIDALKKGVLESKLLPVFCGASLKNIGIQPLLDGIVTYLPDPTQLTLPLMHDPSTHSMQQWDNDARLLVVVFKSELHKNYGIMHYVRVFRGTIKTGSTVFNLNTKKKERITRILKMHSSNTEQAQALQEGDIGVLIGLRNTYTGNTLSNISTPVLLFEPLTQMNPVITKSLSIQNLAERDKLLDILKKLEIEDPSFYVKEDEHTGQVLISGMGELHLDVMATRIRDDYKIPVRLGKPQVSYREGITKAHTEVYNLNEHPLPTQHQDKHINIIMTIKVSPAPRGSGVLFSHTISTKDKSVTPTAVPIPQQWLDSIEHAVRNSATTGILLGYPIIDIDVVLTDCEIYGDGNIEPFLIEYVTAQAFHNATKHADPVMYEPIMKIRISVPTEYAGDAMNTITSQNGGIVHNVEYNNNLTLIFAEAPMSSLFGYSTTIRNATQGRATFSIEFDYYAPVNNPKSI